MDDCDIVARLRQIPTAWPLVREAADEIERLRRNTGCARNQGETQFCAELVSKADEFAKTLTELRQRVEMLTAERDEARQMFCNAMTDHCEEDEARQIAKEQGWDCFKEDGK
jgi:uncharacterized coiled-coil DUF342 family protein